MAVEVKLPRLGQGMEAGTIVRWLKSEGDAVSKGEPLYELDTDKVTQEVEAESDGVLLKIVVADGEVDVGTTVAVIGAEGEEVAVQAATSETKELPASDAGEPPAGEDGDAAGAGATAQKSATPTPTPTPTPTSTEERKEPSGSEPQVLPDAGGAAAVPEGAGEAGAEAEEAAAEAPSETAAATGRVKASPLARRIARERGLELASVTGTGPDGRVIAEDVEKAAAASAAAAAPAPAGAAEELEVEVVQLTSFRKTIARRLTEAWSAPVFQLTVTAHAEALVATRERMVELMREGEVKPTVSDVLTRLVASSLIRHRALNAQFVEGEIHRHASANVGIAVATPNGLVVPVIRQAERKSVQQIAAARADVVARAREGKLQLQDLEGGTFTISNLGMYGVDQFIAVLNPPQVAILAVGTIEQRALVVDSELRAAPTLTMTLTCDHRAIDGSEGAEFLQTLQALVETPSLAL